MSLFPEIDKEIEEKMKKDKEKFNSWVKEQKIFKPSNATEASFFDGVCSDCVKFDYENPKCMIEVEFWAGTPQKEILELEDRIVCIKHSKFNIERYLK